MFRVDSLPYQPAESPAESVRESERDGVRRCIGDQAACWRDVLVLVSAARCGAEEEVQRQRTAGAGRVRQAAGCTVAPILAVLQPGWGVAHTVRTSAVIAVEAGVGWRGYSLLCSGGVRVYRKGFGVVRIRTMNSYFNRGSL